MSQNQKFYEIILGPNYLVKYTNNFYPILSYPFLFLILFWLCSLKDLPQLSQLCNL